MNPMASPQRPRRAARAWVMSSALGVCPPVPGIEEVPDMEMGGGVARLLKSPGTVRAGAHWGMPCVQTRSSGPTRLSAIHLLSWSSGTGPNFWPLTTQYQVGMSSLRAGFDAKRKAISRSEDGLLKNEGEMSRMKMARGGFVEQEAQGRSLAQDGDEGRLWGTDGSCRCDRK